MVTDRLKKLTLTIFVLFVSSAMNIAMASDFKALDNFLLEAKEITNSVSGTSIVVIKDGVIAHEVHAGFADVENELPVDTNSIYYFASATKSLMAFAILLAEEKKMVSRQSTLKDLFPDTNFLYIDPTKYSVQDLLSHTSGLTNEAMTWTFSYTGLHDKTQRNHFLSTLRADEETPKGTFNYSNLGYNLMAIWFDEQMADGWQTGFNELIFTPAKMEKTTAHINLARDRSWPIVKPYSYKYADGKRAIYMNKSDKTLYSVGVFSRPSDWARFLTLLMPLNRENSPFPQSVILSSQDTLINNLDSYYSGYGWGWQHGKVGKHKVLLHTGGFDGASVQVTYSATENLGVVVIHNESGLIANQLNKHLTSLAYSTVLGSASQAAFSLALNDMRDVANIVEKTKAELSEHRAELLTRAKNNAADMTFLEGTYFNEDVGDITISKEKGLLTATWGDLKSLVYPDDKKNVFLLELRPGKFSPLECSSVGATQRLHLNGWLFQTEIGLPLLD